MKKQSLFEAVTEGFKINEGKTNPKDLVGKKGENYHGEKGEIVAAEYVKNYKKLNKYDNSGWMDQDAFDDYGLDSTDILVAFDDGTEVQVYTLGDGGVDLIESLNEGKTNLAIELANELLANLDLVNKLKLSDVTANELVKKYGISGMKKLAKEYNVDISEINEAAKEGNKTEYKKYFATKLKKAGYDSISEIPSDKKDDFFNDVDKGWKGDDEGSNEGKFCRKTGKLLSESADEFVNENRYPSEMKSFRDSVSRNRKAYDNEKDPKKKARLKDWLAGAPEHKKKLQKAGGDLNKKEIGESGPGSEYFDTMVLTDYIQKKYSNTKDVQKAFKNSHELMQIERELDLTEVALKNAIKELDLSDLVFEAINEDHIPSGTKVTFTDKHGLRWKDAKVATFNKDNNSYNIALGTKMITLPSKTVDDIIADKGSYTLNEGTIFTKPKQGLAAFVVESMNEVKKGAGEIYPDWLDKSDMGDKPKKISDLVDGDTYFVWEPGMANWQGDYKLEISGDSYTFISLADGQDLEYTKKEIKGLLSSKEIIEQV